MNGTCQTPAFKGALWLALFFAIGCPDLRACSVSVSGKEEVSDHFDVKVLRGGKPAAGLQIELRTIPRNPSQRSRVVQTGTTDESGLASFAAVKPGSYTVDIKHKEFPSSTDILVRSPSRKTTHETIIVEWPNIEVLHVQSVAGLINGQIKTGNPLNDQIHPVVVPLGEAKLTLLQAASEEIVGSQTASVSGAFSFGLTPPGLYLLHVEAPENAETHQSATTVIFQLRSILRQKYQASVSRSIRQCAEPSYTGTKKESRPNRCPNALTFKRF